MVIKSDKSHNPISTVTATVESEIGKTITKSNKSQNPIVTKSGKHGAYRDRLKGVQILLSNSQAGPGRKVKQEQEEISCKHIHAF